MRLCERPGCSDPAAVQYGVDMSRLLVWLEPLKGDPEYGWGALCRRHAEAMVVPRGWSLDDRREPVPRLFRSPPAETAAAPKPRRRRAKPAKLDVPPIPLPIEPLLVAPSEIEPILPVIPPAAAPVAPPVAARVVDPLPQTVAADAAAAAVALDAATVPGGIPRPWQPVFDDDEEPGGVLQADSPLLKRAFLGARPARPGG